MKSISTRPIFRLSLFTTLNYKITKNSHYLALSTQTHQNPGYGHHPQRHEEESRGVPVSVWWDFVKCGLPRNTNEYGVSQRITNALRAHGIKGPIQITVFGDLMRMSSAIQNALFSSGIDLVHAPSGGKSSDRTLLEDLMWWVHHNPPPAHLFLISGDRYLATVLHRLRQARYNILLAGPGNGPRALCNAATMKWQWSSLLKGENLTGSLFNYPPGGPYKSLYGHYNGPLEHPYEIKSSCLPADESCRQIPKEVMKHIHQILYSYPDGIPISLLRTELNKYNLPIDKDLYGYKKFSRFLLAMPHIVELYYHGDDRIFAQGVDESVPATKSESSGSEEEFEVVTEKSTVSDPKVKAQLTNLQEYQNEGKKYASTSSISMQGMKVKAQEKNLPDLKKEEKQKGSLPKRNVQETQEQDRNVKLQEQQKKVEVASPIVESDDAVTDVSSRSTGFFNRIMSWFKSPTSSEFDDKVKKNAETIDQVNVSPKQLDLFSKE